MKLIAFLLLFPVLASGATYYVTITGSDTAPGDGTAAHPWRTIQKGVNATVAGDTVIVGDGDYGEYVATHANGSSGSPITIVATNAWGATLHQFRVQHLWHIINGFRVSKPSTGLNQSHIRIESGGSNLVLTNNFIGPGCFIISTNASFNATSNSVTCPDANFNTAGFTNGSLVFWGASGLTNLYFTNHDTAHTVLSNSVDGHTMYVSDQITNDLNSGYWLYAYAGTDNNGMRGVFTILSGGITMATNLTIVNNHFEQLAGSALSGTGDGGLIRGNTFTNIPSWYGIIMNGRNSVVESNLWINNPNVLYYTLGEINSLTHPGGGSFFDYQIGHINHYVTAYTTNNVFRYNWLQNVDSQLIVFQYYTGTNDFMTVQSNVFIGFTYTGSIGLNNMTFDHNTLISGGYDFSKSSAIGFGASSGSGQSIETNLNVTSNIWFNIGDHHTLSQEGSFSIVDAINTNTAGNFAAGPETMGFRKLTYTTNQYLVNGGDPLFVNLANPLGPDNKPFTADDGIRPLPTSAIASNGMGALPALPSSTVAAHFIETNVTTWQDDTTTNYSPAWLAKTPFQRTTPERPWTTPETLGSAPLWVTFDASASLDGSTLSHKRIQWYVWNFGDGRIDTVYKIPWIRHLFYTNGTFPVTLTVTTWDGSSSTYSNTYAVSNINHSVFTNHLWLVATNGNNLNDGTNSPFLTIAKAESVVAAGDIVAVLPGSYAENVDINRNVATSANPITFYSYGASSHGFNIRYSDHVFDGFKLDGLGLAAFSYILRVYPAAQRVQLLHNELAGEPTTNIAGVLLDRGTSGVDPSLSPGGCTISFNSVHDLWSTGGNFPVSFTAYGQSNLFQGNFIYNNQGEADCFRLWGVYQTASDNYITNLSAIIENHTDFYQIFGATSVATTNNYDLAQNIVLERNWVEGGQVSVATMQAFSATNAPGNFTNIIFRNNVFKGITAYEVDAAVDGVKVYNNLFYKDPYPAAHGNVLGGDTGHCFGSEFYNNIFFQNNTNYALTNVGWYDIRTNGPGTLAADYNFVCGSNYWAKVPAPPNDYQHWANTGYEAHGINGGNPLFVSEANSDFHLQSTSPLRDAGAAVVTTDWDNTPRTGTVDIGPFEFTETNAPAPPAGTNRFWAGTIRAGRVSKP